MIENNENNSLDDCSSSDNLDFYQEPYREKILQVLSPCSGDGKCFSSCNPPIIFIRKECSFDCQLLKCPNYKVCKNTCPKWYLDGHDGRCRNCDMMFGCNLVIEKEKEGIEKECSICLDVNKWNVKMSTCSHFFCVECFSTLHFFTNKIIPESQIIFSLKKEFELYLVNAFKNKKRSHLECLESSGYKTLNEIDMKIYELSELHLDDDSFEPIIKTKIYNKIFTLTSILLSLTKEEITSTCNSLPENTKKFKRKIKKNVKQQILYEVSENMKSLRNASKCIKAFDRCVNKMIKELAYDKIYSLQINLDISIETKMEEMLFGNNNRDSDDFLVEYAFPLIKNLEIQNFREGLLNNTKLQLINKMKTDFGEDFVDALGNPDLSCIFSDKDSVCTYIELIIKKTLKELSDKLLRKKIYERVLTFLFPFIDKFVNESYKDMLEIDELINISKCPLCRSISFPDWQTKEGFKRRQENISNIMPELMHNL